MNVILTEKKEVATLYAKVLGFHYKDGCYRKDDACITWASGHFVGLAEPKKYDPKFEKWNIQDLPIIPERMKYELVQGHKQFKIIKSLFQKANLIINASDPGREGELIFRLIYNYTGVKKPVKRLWAVSRNPEAIKAAYQNISPISNYNGLYAAALSRLVFDWLVGINLTRLITKKINLGRAYHIGRVQTPTLRLICERYLDHINFKPETYWQPELSLSYDNQQFKAKYKGRFTDQNEALKLVEDIGNLTTVNLVDSEKKGINEKPPQLYDITEIQKRANVLFGYTLDATLAICQSLYMKGVTTYPRTDSRYLPEDMKREMPTLIKALEQVPELSNAAQNIDTGKLTFTKRFFDDSKLTDHFAIIPTGKTTNDLSEQEHNVFLLIASSIIMAFLPDCQKETTIYSFEPSAYVFISKGTVTKDPGWRIAQIFKQAKKDDISLPLLPESSKVNLLEIINEKKLTKAPALLTGATLVHLMKHAGKLVDDDTNTDEIMNQFGLGTGATRDGILKNLIDRNYALRKAKKIIPTETGLFLYEQTKDLSISNVELTGRWEYSLNQISDGALKVATFKNEIETFVKNTVTEIKDKKIDRSSQLMECLKCKQKSLLQKAILLDCTNGDCNFQLWFTVAKKKLTPKQINDLMNNGKTSKIKGFKSKAGKTFSASLKFDKELKIKFEFK